MRWLLLMALAGCAQTEAQPRVERTAPVVETLFDGRIEPTNATELNAPQNSFRVANWASDSSWIKVTKLVDEGAEVKSGDAIAHFEFRGKQALPNVQSKIDSARAARTKAQLERAGELRDLRVEKAKRDLAAEKARLDTGKEGAVSARQLALYRIEHDIARFEARAVRRRLAALERAAEAEADWHDREVARAEAQLVRYHAYEKRFRLYAPHDGVVRHAWLPWERRKVRKGDGMASGRHVVSVARDERLSVRFYVPEHRVATVQIGDEVRVRSVSSDAEYPATIRTIERFPQELGFLHEDDQLPDAREKAFAVLADLDAETGELAAGNEVRVVPP